MKTLFLSTLLLVTFSFVSKAQSIYSPTIPLPSSNSYQYKDYFGNSYKSSSNLYNDRDKDGYINYYDRNDQNPNVGFFSTPSISTPSYYNSKSSYLDYNSGRTIYEGPKGGQYYINSNGNKTYVKPNPYGF